MPTSPFAKFQKQAWPYEFRGTLNVKRLVGGIPSDPKVASGWIKKNLGATDEQLLHARVAEVMLERGIDRNEAAQIIIDTQHLNGFKRDENGGLYIEGRQLKAAIKEATSVALAGGKLPVGRSFGSTGKYATAFVAEHVCVMEDKLPLGLTEPTGIHQRFVSTHKGTGIQYEEYCDDVDINFTILTDHKFTDEQWAMIWLTGEQQGIGATRSQGYGRYMVTQWETVHSPKS